ncbi:hypothetical protein N7466_004180 [Penicillium verhagenii]|uniref:uncharacterized protein n=1 Tax=Penicillium verhagenii TaxID=1562060 RepID=UPI002545A3D6|nr:uncharacterized protein N7466_004180 [Penicillium verhagenii]KAJ5934633.1 hypothetical protein N7466_004180 [Penicillium verhagenii]
MEPQSAMSWSEQLHENTLIPVPGEDEFSNFLEFDMHFSDMEGHGPAHSQMQEQHSMGHPPTTTAPTTMASDPRSHPYPTSMEGLAMDFSHHTTQSQPSMPYASTPSMTPGFCAQDASHMSQQSGQHYMQGAPMIPPTPNSIEMHGNAVRYSQRMDDNPEMYDHRYSRVEDQVCIRFDVPNPFSPGLTCSPGRQALYTPLVSPAMTPLENQFQLDGFAVPGEYSITPLTSPALEAQPHSTNGFYHSRHISDVGFVANNVDPHSLPGTSAPGSPSIIRKTNRRRTSTASRLSGRSKVKQSPSIRAQTQRKGRQVPNSEEFYNSLSQELSRPQNNDVRSLQASSTEGSGQDSVSPEPLSEPLMLPPALPSSRKSPAIAPQPAQPPSAATPATLMRIQRAQHTQDPSGKFMGRAQLEYHDETMEDISLPEAVATSQPRPKINRIDTSLRTNMASPAISANLTPSLESRSAPPSGSIAISPRTAAMPSPSGPIPKRSDPSRSSISGRKRPSVSSTQASPQLRPKISPSIQPLMRAGDFAQDALLASKSNYQHILDGTLPSGVSYPETLAENLSSKRTNHKLAEQGRRNRINSALKEIEALVPPDFVQARLAKEAALTGIKPGDKEKDKSANQAISKASAVEMAIDYIKSLQKSLDETAAKLAATEAKLAGFTLNDESNTPTASSSEEVAGKTDGLESEVKSS